MKFKYLRHLALLTLLLVFACSKDDGENNNSLNLNGGDAFRYEVVSIDTGGMELDNNEYDATFNGTSVQVEKTGKNTLAFLVPPSAALGQNELIIPALNNSKITYNVLDPVLSQPAAETMSFVFSQMQEMVSTYQGSEGIEDLEQITVSFNQVFENATPEEKEEMAKVYIANRSMFNGVLSAQQGRNPISDLFMFSKHTRLVLAAGISTVATVAATPYGPHTVAFATVAGIAIWQARNAFLDILDQTFKSINLEIGSITGTNGRGIMNTVLSLQDNVARESSFRLTRRGLDQTDSGSTSAVLQQFFEDTNTYNRFIVKLNTVSNTLNNLIPFCNIPAASSNTLQATATPQMIPATEDDMSNISFTIDHPNLQLVNYGYVSGRLSLTVKILGQPSVVPVQANLNYSYADDFNAFTGYLPIEVSTEPQNCGTVTDIDGNVYQTITIGDQCWMTTNLNVSHYRNGDPIINITDNGQWMGVAHGTGAWCYYNNDPLNGSIYGKLYNFFVIEDERGIAPEGWRVATAGDYQQLATYLGGAAVAGGKMKSTTLWNSPNTGATNSSGFTSVPSGGRIPVVIEGTSPTTTEFTGLGEYASTWSTAAWNYGNGLPMDIKFNVASMVPVASWPSLKRTGFSIRCIKN